MAITNGLGFCFLRSPGLVSHSDQPGSGGFLLSRNTCGWNWALEGAGSACSMLHRADGSPASCEARPLTSLRGSVCRQHAGSCGVQRWGFLSPLGFTHPLSIKSVSPLSFPFFVCVCVLIIRWLLACFPNPTLTFLSATEKLAFHPLESSQGGQGEFQLCAQTLGDTLMSNRRRGCENRTLRASRRLSEAMQSTPTSVPLYRRGPRVPERYSDLHKVTQAQSEQNDSVFENSYHKAFSSPGNHSAQKAFPRTKNLQWKWCLTS